ncbi:FKBP-type peptidyl-prolyl cis-trans isomerase [Pontibacter sp. G13]|uniref:FKBP-type peptidyl-prolyl cis-trans isomerase n=1 Tax=Pontibacter sp. G13 TaxID=3074898 RepID=UPI00288A252F|nr:FKBP-type peptidyl-prolyl cis-trans isomerase [Pontibacter sp. G13]WNJ20833.1 FKBP-type peptidyl-prolyl cis-trans isomerase [Pontibacter sp. G13]
MRLIIWVFAACLALPNLAWAQDELANRTDSMSYALGMDVGTNLSRIEVPVNGQMIYQGMMDALGEEGASALTDEQMRTLLAAFQQEVAAAQRRKADEAGQKARAEGEVFLEENGQKEGVVTTPSGLQYLVLQEGAGEHPTAASTVKVHYEGKLLNGEIFDSSIKRGEPIEFPLGGVIPGWTEGVQLMTPGAKYRFFIPYNLAYGERGAPPSIGPYETLIFDVELLEIK